MTLFALYMPRTGGAPEAVPDRFSWFAALLPPVHAIVHGLWGQLALFVFGALVLMACAGIVGPDAVRWLYGLGALAFGFAAPGARRRALLRRGFRPAGDRLAGSADLARLAALGEHA